jgi:hypothetical protein
MLLLCKVRDMVVMPMVQVMEIQETRRVVQFSISKTRIQANIEAMKPLKTQIPRFMRGMDVLTDRQGKTRKGTVRSARWELNHKK